MTPNATAAIASAGMISSSSAAIAGVSPGILLALFLITFLTSLAAIGRTKNQ